MGGDIDGFVNSRFGSSGTVFIVDTLEIQATAEVVEFCGDAGYLGALTFKNK